MILFSVAKNTTQCPACLLVMHEYGADERTRSVRLDAAGILWCAHHRRVSRQLREQLGPPAAIQIIVGLERFALFHRAGHPGQQGGSR